MSGNYVDAAVGAEQLMVAVIPDLSPAVWPPPMTTYDNHYWAHITPPGLAGFITQIINDPSGPGTLYVYTTAGQIFRGTNLVIGYTLDMNMNIIPDPGVTSITWTQITGNLPGGGLPNIYPQPMALDKNIVRVGNTFKDRLYVGTASEGIFSRPPCLARDSRR